MTITFSAGEQDREWATVDLIDEVHLLFTEAAQELGLTLREVRKTRGAGAKAAQAAMKDLKAALQLAVEERNKVGKLRSQAAGAVGTGSLDFDAARDEIGRRLACLRDAGAGG